MKIRTPNELGALIRDRRTKMGLDQTSLAQRARTSRKWVVDVEKGKPRAAIGLILRTLQVLGVSLEVRTGENTPRQSISRRPIPSVDLDQHLAGFRKKL